MPRKTVKGAGYTASEVALWRATTPQQKAYWREKVMQERLMTGQGIHFFEHNPVGKLIGPALQAMVHGSQYIPAGIKTVGRLMRKAVLGRGKAKKPRARK